MSKRATRRWGAALALAFALTAGAARSASTRARTAEVTAGEVQDRVVARAMLVPVEGVAEVRARVDGRVLRVLVREGERVEAGQLLADIEGDTLEQELARRQAERAALAASARGVAEGARVEEQEAAAAEVAASRQELTLATRRQARTARLRAAGSETEQAADEAEHGVEVARARLAATEARLRLARAGGKAADVRASEARVAAAEASIAQARSEVGRTRLIAPITGVVLARRIDAGDTLSLATTPPPAFEIADVSRLEVRVEVEETDALRVPAGVDVVLTTPGGGAIVGRGRIGRIGARLERRTIGVEDAKVRADGQVRAAWASFLDGAAGAGLPIGQRLEAVIDLAPKAVRAMAPREAVRVREGRAVVEVPWGPLSRDVPVSLGLADEHNVELEGVAVGTRILLLPR